MSTSAADITITIMSTTTTELTKAPAHIPESLVRDLDYFNPPGADADVHRAWKRIQDEEPEILRKVSAEKVVEPYETLVRRYEGTRRRHPMAGGGVVESISIEGASSSRKRARAWCARCALWSSANGSRSVQSVTSSWSM